MLAPEDFLMNDARSRLRPGRLWIWAGLALLLAGVGGFFVWQRYLPRTAPDMVAALHANNRGAGYMERFDYPAAETAFREAVTPAPAWLPAKINLGLALLNQPDPLA